MQAAQAGLIPPQAVPGEIQKQVGEALRAIAPAVAIDRYGKGGNYLLEYAEDIQLFGLSFNTVVGTSGWALQGEYSLRPNAPLAEGRAVRARGGPRTDNHCSGTVRLRRAYRTCRKWLPPGGPQLFFGSLLQRHIAGSTPRRSRAMSSAR